jgi:hypothetical protein
MTSEVDSARQLTQLICGALTDTFAADKNALLAAASDFLDAAKLGDSDRLALARRVAYIAIDRCVFEYPEYYQDLKMAVQAFRLSLRIKATADTIGTT